MADNPPTALEFDHHSAEHAADPYGSLSRVREKCPFAYSSTYGGFWMATGWEQVKRVAADPGSFSSGAAGDGTSATHIPRDPMLLLLPPLELEPPEFVAYRRLVSPYMSPRAIADMENGIHYWVDWFIDRTIERGSMSVPTEFATPVPSSITIDWIGLAPEEWQFYWSARHNPDMDQRRADFYKLYDRLRGEILARRESPRHDVLSVIANGEVNGGLIEVERAMGLAEMLIAGGTETTGDLFAGALVHLDRQREFHQRMLEDDGFMRTATEEYLRVVTPTLANGRVAKCPVQMDGQTINDGDQMMLGWASANRDPAVFDAPDEVRLDRWPNRHLSFGIGPHRCLGSNMARAMFRVMTRRLIERMPDFHIVAAEPGDRAVFASFAKLEIEFTPGPRVLPDTPPAQQFTTIFAAGDGSAEDA